MRKPDYGIDAPITQRNLLVLGAVCAAMLPIYPRVGQYSFWPGVVFLASASIMYWGSRSGKLRLRDRLLNAVPWRGDEAVLDVGCGHGLLMIGAAKRVPKGSVVGVDVWRDVDQANNKPEKALDNASIERVGDRIKVRDADARELPFAPETFDVVLSSWAIHNISVSTGRSKAIKEMVRVLKPGGWIGILDIEDTKQYATELRRAGLAHVVRGRPNFMFLLPTYMVVGQKPEAASSEGKAG